MSEYQYYEFQAVDRPLSQTEMQRLRGYSTRATITPSSFLNVYHYGDFKGNADDWMAKYFDGFLYLANWGSRSLMFRLSESLLPAETAKRYCTKDPHGIWTDDALMVKTKGGNIILKFSSNQDGGGDWIEGDGLLGSLMPIRAELARGDLRALYLIWLRGIQELEPDDPTPEPPVPPGLKSLSASLTAFVEFLEIDVDLVAAAAEASPDLATPPPDPEAAARWVAGMPTEEKDALIVRLLRGDEGNLGLKLQAQFERATAGPPSAAPATLRTAGQLIAGVAIQAEKRQQAEARRAAAEKHRQAQLTAAAREKRLETLTARIPKAWVQVEELLSTRKGKAYAEAVQLLVDLCELASRRQEKSEFAQKLAELRTRHATRKAFQVRLAAAGL